MCSDAMVPYRREFSVAQVQRNFVRYITYWVFGVELERLSGKRVAECSRFQRHFYPMVIFFVGIYVICALVAFLNNNAYANE